ncbi:Zn-dependent exopeptidase [Phanerochaete sordida]|uniref:Zn-dependent exopeptidase n=1 Tax=Phanerochaete sordida TaxID=48140 RepID=A0A9P3L866_9APHY|nr:Zn-dependent exopeptidase [Phanerochaete sordida]
MDYKPLPTDEKAGIPAPVQAPTPAHAQDIRAKRARRIAKVAWHLAVLALIFLTLRNWGAKIRAEVDKEASAWLGQYIGFDRQHHHHHGGGKKPPLHGKAAELLYLTVPNPASAIKASREYATKPHMAGTPGDFDTAKLWLALLERELGAVAPAGDGEPVYSAGSDASRNATLAGPRASGPTAWIDVYYPVMNTPVNHSVTILGEDGLPVWVAPLEEVADATDPEAGKYFDAVPAFHGLSASGEVEGKLIYANYGRQEDFKALLEKGVDFTSSIVIVRYGGIFRGLKVKGAQELGAAGVLIFSDPTDDGAVTEENGYLAYPYGPARNPTSVQRGSVQYLSIYPGDPTTPGYPAYENSTRTEGENMPKIPSLPISWANAQVLLNEINEGGLNRTVSLVNHVDTRVIPIWNTMGVIPGHIRDEVVVVGNHRDAWVMGATDPSSGTVSAHEFVKGLGVLLKQGWKPLRTLVIASWDAEEYGLMGSTEWGEDFSDFIDEHVVAYVNLDSSVSGSRFSASASPSLSHLIRGAAQDVPHPTKPGKSLWDAREDIGVFEGPVSEEVLAMFEPVPQLADSVGVNPLGSGSDYTVFLQQNGIASTNMGFGGTPHDAAYHYHSVYDSERWQELYGDPGFFRHVAIANLLGLQTLRLLDSIVLPINTTHYAFELESYLQRVESIADSQALDVDFSSLRTSLHKLQKASIALDEEKTEAEKALKKIIHKLVRRKVIHRKARKAICAVKKLFGKECHKKHHGHELHAKEDVAVANIPSFTTEEGKAVHPRVGRAPVWVKEHQEGHKCGMHGKGHHKDHHKKKLFKKLKKAVKRVQKANAKLVAFERGFISKEGIKDREWYKHLGVAPGKWLGYGATTLPALTESFTIEHNATLAKYEIKRLRKLVDKLAHKIEP